MHPDDRQRVSAKFRAVLADPARDRWEDEYRFMRADGTCAQVLDRGFVIRDDRAKAIRMIGAMQDITERKRVEARLADDLAALTRMHALSGMLLSPEGLPPLLQEIMDAAITIAGAEWGILQLLEGDSLRITAHHGHRLPFLKFFTDVENRASVCGEALQHSKRVVVPDVEASALFAGTASLAALREADIRAVLSTPMISRSGMLLGILTTHWGVPYTPDEHVLWRIDLLARQAADLIERQQMEEVLRESETHYQTLYTDYTAALGGLHPAEAVSLVRRSISRAPSCAATMPKAGENHGAANDARGAF